MTKEQKVALETKTRESLLELARLSASFKKLEASVDMAITTDVSFDTLHAAQQALKQLQESKVEERLIKLHALLLKRASERLNELS